MRQPEIPRPSAIGDVTRGENLKAITVPTVVIHDSDDPMVRPRNGRSVARAIGGARYVVVDGTGHDVPTPVSRPVVEARTENIGLR